MKTRPALVFAAIAGLAFAFGLLFLDGCKPPSVPEREAARAAVMVSAEAVHAFDVECARVVRATKDRELGEKCDAFYRRARPSLVATAVVVDAWSSPDTRADVTCVVVNTGHELALLARELAGKGGKALPLVDDALRLVSLLGECHPVETDAIEASDAGGDR